MKTQTLFLFVLLFWTQVFAHGEDVPGPHGGEIRMPGAFHTELVQVDERNFRVYLLDLEWANPTIEKSSVDLKLAGKKSKKAKCTKSKDSFLCVFPSTFSLNESSKTKEIIVEAERNSQKGNAVRYELPLKFSMKQKSGN